MEEIKAQEDLQPLEQAAMPDSPGLSDGAQLLAGADRHQRTRHRRIGNGSACRWRY